MIAGFSVYGAGAFQPPSWNNAMALPFLNGDTLPPAQNVQDSMKTDDDGRFLFTEGPLRPYWFEVSETRSEEALFKESGERRVVLMYSEGESPTLAVETVPWDGPAPR
jgi:hypothetical protein